VADSARARLRPATRALVSLSRPAHPPTPTWPSSPLDCGRWRQPRGGGGGRAWGVMGPILFWGAQKGPPKNWQPGMAAGQGLRTLSATWLSGNVALGPMPHLYPFSSSTIPVKGFQAKTACPRAVDPRSPHPAPWPGRGCRDRSNGARKPCSTEYWEARQARCGHGWKPCASGRAADAMGLTGRAPAIDGRSACISKPARSGPRAADGLTSATQRSPDPCTGCTLRAPAGRRAPGRTAALPGSPALAEGAVWTQALAH